MSEHERAIHNYLRQKVGEGREYFKAKYIAKDIGGVSPKSVGAILYKLSVNPKIKDLEITQWSNSISTTWRVVRASNKLHMQ